MARRIVDLSQLIYQGMPVYPGHVKTVIWEHLSHEESRRQIGTGFSYQTRGLMMSDHGPTHVDALNHIDPAPDAPSIDELPVELFLTDGICLDVSHVVPPEMYFTKPVLDEALKKADLEIRKGDTVLLHTGHYSRNYGTDKWLAEYCGLDGEATRWLADRGVVNVGVDAPSIDNYKDRTYPSHTVCRERSLLNTENLCNLDQVAGTRFLFIGLPLRIKGGTGSPIRAVAVFE